MPLPKAIVTIAPTLSPPQDLYRSSFIARLTSHFDADVRCADESSAPSYALEDLREGISFAMGHVEQSMKGRNDVYLSAYVLPAAVERRPGAGDSLPPFPVVLISVRSWRQTEWTFAYPIESAVPRSVIEVVACSIADVRKARDSRDSTDPEEQKAVVQLITQLRLGIDGAIQAVAPDPKALLQ